MKPQKTKKKLSLGKMTIYDLNGDHLNRIHGGVEPTYPKTGCTDVSIPETVCCDTNTCVTCVTCISCVTCYDTCDCSNTNCYTCQHSPCR
jgi:hypothetical protein